MLFSTCQFLIVYLTFSRSTFNTVTLSTVVDLSGMSVSIFLYRFHLLYVLSSLSFSSRLLLLFLPFLSFSHSDLVRNFRHFYRPPICLDSTILQQSRNIPTLFLFQHLLILVRSTGWLFHMLKSSAAWCSGIDDDSKTNICLKTWMLRISDEFLIFFREFYLWMDWKFMVYSKMPSQSQKKLSRYCTETNYSDINCIFHQLFFRKTYLEIIWLFYQNN